MQSWGDYWADLFSIVSMYNNQSQINYTVGYYRCLTTLLIYER